MRVETVECANISEAFKLCPWAVKAIKIYGNDRGSAYTSSWAGYKCFESREEFENWDREQCEILKSVGIKPSWHYN